MTIRTKRIMARIRCILCMSLPLCAILACDDGVLTPMAPQMVVEGWIEDGGFPVVIVTKTIPLTGERLPMDSLSNYIMRWATVSVSDGREKVYLTGKYAEGYFPPYIYTTTRMRGEAGRKYTLEVEYRDTRATAETTIPGHPEVDSLWVEPSVGNDTLFRVRATIADRPGERNYHQLFCCVGSRSRQFRAAYLGSIGAGEIRGTATYDIGRPREMGSKRRYTPYYFAGDSVAVKVARVDEDSYNFWSDYTKNLNNGGNLFFASTGNMRYNVRGAMGYWCGMAAWTKYLVIGED